MKETETLVVTRHKGLIQWLRARDLIPRNAIIRTHVRAEDVANKHVIGVLPLSLAAGAASVTEVPLKIPPYARGDELSEKQVEEYRSGPVTRYEVRQVESFIPKKEKKNDV